MGLNLFSFPKLFATPKKRHEYHMIYIGHYFTWLTEFIYSHLYTRAPMWPVHMHHHFFCPASKFRGRNTLFAGGLSNIPKCSYHFLGLMGALIYTHTQLSLLSKKKSKTTPVSFRSNAVSENGSCLWSLLGLYRITSF